MKDTHHFDLPVGSVVREKAGYPPYVVGPGEYTFINAIEEGKSTVREKNGFNRQITKTYWEPVDNLTAEILKANGLVK